MAVDRRVRLRPRDGAEDYIYGDGTAGMSSTDALSSSLAQEQAVIDSIINGTRLPEASNTHTQSNTGLLSILRNTNGMIWPSTPTINVVQAANYDSTQPTHSIAAYNTFESTANTTISVSGDFHVGNANEAYYLLACIHYLRTLTKMDFGRSSQTRGTPPPVVLFSAYGNYMFNDIPVIVKSTSFEFRDDVDYIQVPIKATQEFGYYLTENAKDSFFGEFVKKDDKVWVPQVMNINVSLEQQPTGEFVSKEFNLNEFKRGGMLVRGGFI